MVKLKDQTAAAATCQTKDWWTRRLACMMTPTTPFEREIPAMHKATLKRPSVAAAGAHAGIEWMVEVSKLIL
jgi:hypothetical protein